MARTRSISRGLKLENMVISEQVSVEKIIIFAHFNRSQPDILFFNLIFVDSYVPLKLPFQPRISKSVQV